MPRKPRDRRELLTNTLLAVVFTLLAIAAVVAVLALFASSIEFQ